MPSPTTPYLQHSEARTPYRGRFAPTPSGPLHLGSLLTALCSHLDARANAGRWLLRIDDLDGPRCDPAHIDTIQRQLEAHGLMWDERPRLQSRSLSDYQDALQVLQRSDLTYACSCTRRTLRAAAAPGPLGPVYAGTCRNRTLAAEGRVAWRLRVPQGGVGFVDEWQGPQQYDWQRDLGDFVLWRRDGLPGYALSCAVDELAMGITHVVRGGDLLAMTVQHREVIRSLGHPAPVTRHGPLLCATDGRKLSKQNHARALETREALANLHKCCAWLQLPLPAVDEFGDVESLMAAAIHQWQRRPNPSFDMDIVVQ